jgi:hypothetical protein
MDYMARVADHAVRQTLADLEGALSESLRLTAETPEALDRAERINSVAKHVTLRLDAANARLVPPAALSNANAEFSNALTAVLSFNADQNQAHLDSADNHVDAALLHLASVQVPYDQASVEALADTVSATRRSISGQRSVETKLHEGLASTIENLRGEVEAIKSTLDAQQGRVDQFVTSSQQAMTEAENARSKLFQDSLNNLAIEYRSKAEELAAEYRTIAEERSEAAVAELESATEELKTERAAVQTAEETRSDSFGKLARSLKKDRETHATSIRERLQNLDESCTQQITTLEHNTEEALSVIRKHRDEAAALVELISSSAMSHEYSKTAASQGKYTKIWQAVAASTFAALIGYLVIWGAPATIQVSWPGVIYRISTTLSFVILGAYAARQAAVHRQAEQRAKRLHLEFTAIEPYLASLPDEQRHWVRMELAGKLFGNDTSLPQAAPQIPNAARFVESAMQVVERGKR